MKKTGFWKIVFALCCLFYMGWVMNVGSNEFDRINSQYRDIIDQLDGGKIRTAAIEELSVECLKKSNMLAEREEEACLSWPRNVIEAREKKIEERLIRARERGTIKVVLFYAGFVLIFLLGPPFLVYLLIAGIIKLKEKIKITR